MRVWGQGQAGMTYHTEDFKSKPQKRTQRSDRGIGEDQGLRPLATQGLRMSEGLRSHHTCSAGMLKPAAMKNMASPWPK